MLGILHKRVLGKCHPGVMAILPFARIDDQADYNSKALDSFGDVVNFQVRFCQRSLFAYVHIYNRLPQALVDLSSVKSLQTKLTHLAKHRAQTDQEGWRRSFQDCDEIWQMFYENN